MSLIETKRKYDPCDLLRMENIAIPLSYFNIGFATSFLCTPLNIYMVNVLNVEPQMQSTLGICDVPYLSHCVVIYCMI